MKRRLKRREKPGEDLLSMVLRGVRADRGKSGSSRTLIATNRGSRWFFVFSFEKNDRANISAKELVALQTAAADLLKLTAAQLDGHVESSALQEICHDNQDES